MTKAKKKPSLTVTIKRLREELKQHKDWYFLIARKKNKIEEKLLFFEKLLPAKFYKIKFTLKANNENVYEFEDIIKSYSAEMAIAELLLNKTFPESFKLLNIQCLA